MQNEGLNWHETLFTWVQSNSHISTPPGRQLIDTLRNSFTVISTFPEQQLTAALAELPVSHDVLGAVYIPYLR